jgi:hypothetical protein
MVVVCSTPPYNHPHDFVELHMEQDAPTKRKGVIDMVIISVFFTADIIDMAITHVIGT